MVLPNTKVLARMQDEIWSHALCRFTCRHARQDLASFNEHSWHGDTVPAAQRIHTPWACHTVASLHGHVQRVRTFHMRR